MKIGDRAIFTTASLDPPTQRAAGPVEVVGLTHHRSAQGPDNPSGEVAWVRSTENGHEAIAMLHELTAAT